MDTDPDPVDTLGTAASAEPGAPRPCSGSGWRTDPDIVRGVLVVASAGDPLLAAGACGAVPPRVLRFGPAAGGQDVVAAGAGRWFAPAFVRGLPLETALPLWWGGVPVPEGWDRARRVLASQQPSTAGWVLANDQQPSLSRTVQLAELLARFGIGRVVLVDADAREVQPRPVGEPDLDEPRSDEQDLDDERAATSPPAADTDADGDGDGDRAAVESVADPALEQPGDGRPADADSDGDGGDHAAEAPAAVLAALDDLADAVFSGRPTGTVARLADRVLEHHAPR